MLCYGGKCSGLKSPATILCIQMGASHLTHHLPHKASACKTAYALQRAERKWMLTKDCLQSNIPDATEPSTCRKRTLTYDANFSWQTNLIYSILRHQAERGVLQPKILELVGIEPDKYIHYTQTHRESWPYRESDHWSTYLNIVYTD